MNEFGKPQRDYAAVGIPQIECGGLNIYIIRWGIEPNIVEGETQGVKCWAKWFEGMPTLGDLVDAMVRVRYTVSDELALLRQRESKADEFAEYNAFVEACKAEAKVVLGIENGEQE